MLAATQPALLAQLERLAPYARSAVEASATHALRWHARALGPEHLLWHLMRDERCAAHRAVVHAFADPESIALEALALCEGLLVVGSGITLPFSELATRALFAARALAQQANAAEVSIAHVLEASVGQLPADVRALVGATSTNCVEAAVVIDPAAGDGLFRHYGAAARRALSRACKLAHRFERDAIGPAHLLIAGLETEPAAGNALGLSLTRSRAALAGRDEDSTAAPERPIEFDEPFARFLGAARPGTDTLKLLGLFVTEGSQEIQALLLRHRVTLPMIEHAGPRFLDP